MAFGCMVIKLWLFLTILLDSWTPAKAQGVVHIPFLDIAEMEGTQLVTPDSEGLETSDYFSDPIFVDYGIPIGARDDLTTVAYVLSDGAITFDRGARLYLPQTYPLQGDLSDLQIVSVFLADHDPRSSGTVRYKVFETVTEEMRTVSEFIRNRTASSSFGGTWMLVAEWRDVPANGGDPNRVNSYQAIIISDRASTYSIFTYNCNQLQWLGQIGEYAAVGYNVLGTTENFQSFANHPLSRSAGFGRAACTNRGDSVPWTNLVYQIGVADPVQMKRSRCLARVDRDKILFPSGFDRFRFSLPDCPCSFFQALFDSRFSIFFAFCFVSRFPVYDSVSQSYIRYRCCYSFRFALMTDDVSGEGSVLFETPSFSFAPSEYNETTVSFQNDCCGEVGLCDEFYGRRPTTDCSNYSPPFFSWGVGDPHINTMDGANYTFNGWGEYTLFTARGFSLQGRTMPVNLTMSDSATQWSAFAFGSHGNTFVEVRLVNDSMQVLVNATTDITDTLLGVNDNNENFTSVFFRRTRSNTISALWSNGISISVSLSLGLLSFVASIPQEFRGTTLGLLGDFNGDASDDFMYRNGTFLDADASDSMIHAFGQSWQIDPEDSLFTYPPGLSTTDFSVPDHEPAFLNEVITGAPQEVLEACDGDARCIYDASQTRNIAVGQETMRQDSSNMLNQALAANNPPNITGPATFMATIGQQSSFEISVTDTSSFTFEIISGDVGSLVQDENDTTLYNFTWLPTEIPSSAIAFLATEENNGVIYSNMYEPQVEFCGCLNGGTCTLNGVVDRTANLLVLNCICTAAYDGRYCEEDADGCRFSPCFEGAECEAVMAPGVGVICGPCPQGYGGNGTKCTDINECVEDNVCAQNCTNTAGSFICSCMAGYNLINGTECQNVDECLVLNGGCHQVCQDTEGSFECSCEEGFRLLSDNINCEVLPDMMCDNATNCTQECLFNVTTNMDVCSCFRGYTLNTDNFTCDDIDECLASPCAQLCDNTDGSFECSCEDGYTVNGRTCEDIDECFNAALAGRMACEHESQLCINTQGNFSCECPGDTEFLDGQCRERIVTTRPPPVATTEATTMLTDNSVATASMANTESPPITTPVHPVLLANTVVITLAGISVEEFDVAQQERFKQTMADILNEYCAENRCGIVFFTRKRQLPVSADEIVLTNIRDDSQNGVSFEMYILSPGYKRVLSQQAVYNAVQENVANFTAAGFAGLSIRTLIPTTTPPPPRTFNMLSAGAVAGIIIAILAVIALVVVIYCWLRYGKLIRNLGTENIDITASTGDGGKEEKDTGV